MNLLKSQYNGIIVFLFILIIYFNLMPIDGISVENEINRKDDDYMSKEKWDYVDGTYYHDDDERRSSQVLSRKRRYLTFPSGSSFQLVYDLIIGVVDYTNYLILGVTSAVAWQLPSDTPSAIIETLTDRLKDGTLGTSRNDTIENIKYVDTKPKKKWEQYPQKPAYITSFTNPSFVQPQSSSYYTNNQFHPPMDTNYYSSSPVQYSQPTNILSRKHDNTDYYSTRPNPLTEWKDSNYRRVSSVASAPSLSSKLASKLTQWWNSKNNNNNNNYNKGQYRKKPTYVRKQRIFPVFAKRSTDGEKRHGISGRELNKIDHIHLRYQRSSRQELYVKVEKYLETHNKNGHECVLKALCETGQKGTAEDPGTFVGEIMRSLFTMPESEDPVHNYKHKIYDDAHAHPGNCTDKYPLCPESVWTADFIF